MDNQPQPTKQGNKALWIVLTIVVLAIAGYGVYAYVSGQGNKNTNNTNGIANQNTSAAANSNTALNTNTSVNTNTTANTNTTVNTNTNTNTNTVDTTSWKTYRNEEYGYTFQYPSDMKVDDYRDYDKIYGLTWLDNKIVPKPGGVVPLSINIYRNSLNEVKQAFEKKYTMSSWTQTTIGTVTGESAKATFSENFFHYYYIFYRTNYTVLIETTDPTYILPTFQFN